MDAKAIGHAAGQGWKSLGPLVPQAVGWLARGNKVELERQCRAVHVPLAAPEAKTWGRSSGG